MNEITTTDVIESVVIGGDLAKLTPTQRVSYYKSVCSSLGLNPLTKPFSYINLNGKLTLYANKDAADQLRALKGISIDKPEIQFQDEWIIVTVSGEDVHGRKDSDVGVVNKKDMRGDFGNALMKAVTKAKRRLTLSICGLGMLDETEIETIKEAKPVIVEVETGELLDAAPFVEEETVKVIEQVKPATPPPPELFPEEVAVVADKPTFCELHMVEMTKHSKDGKSWFSHKTDSGAWCSGKPQIRQQSAQA